MEGFIASNLHPSNLNEWVSVFNEDPTGNAHLVLDQGLVGAPKNKRRKKSKCIGSSKGDPNFFLG